MGICGTSKNLKDPATALKKSSFSFILPIGRGGFGRVWKVTHKKEKSQYAVKAMLKTRVAAKYSVALVLNERNLLARLSHPFIINIHFSFQDKNNLYLVMDLLEGGDLRYHLNAHNKFTERDAQFFCACIITALNYIHENNVIHKDIKPENLVFESSGYLRVTDFGVARAFRAGNNEETSGTPGYMAPEVLCRQEHSFSADFFAVGVILYEIIMGKRPYLGRTREDIRAAVLAKQVKISKPLAGWSCEAIDFCNHLIQRKPEHRLGATGAYELKEHPWLSAFPFEKLRDKELIPEFQPKATDNFDARQIRADWKDSSLLLNMSQVLASGMFPGYSFIRTLQRGSPN